MEQKDLGLGPGRGEPDGVCFQGPGRYLLTMPTHPGRTAEARAGSQQQAWGHCVPSRWAVLTEKLGEIGSGGSEVWGGAPGGMGDRRPQKWVCAEHPWCLVCGPGARPRGPRVPGQPSGRGVWTRPHAAALGPGKTIRAETATPVRESLCSHHGTTVVAFLSLLKTMKDCSFFPPVPVTRSVA